MRIAVLTHGVSPFGHQYAKAFRDRGHQAEVWSMTPFEATLGQGPARCLGPTGFRPWETRERLVPYLRTLRTLRRTVREESPDILMALYMSSAGVIACLSGHPHVVTSALGSDVFSHVGRRFWRAVFRWEVRRACLVHAVSPALADALRDRAGADPARMVVAPIGIDTGLLGYVEPSARPQAGRILCTRAHWPAYDQATLVRAAAILRRRGVACRLAYTSRTGVEATRQLVAGAGIEDMVTFKDGYEYDELPGLLAAADVYVSTSLSDGTSQSLLEALATGTFPVVTDIPANRPWVEHGRTGLLFPAGDAEALADRIEEALARPDLRAAAGPINRALVMERGDLYRGTDRLLAAFEQALGGPTGGPRKGTL